MSYKAAIIDAAARAGFVQAWASYMENKGHSLRGELMDQAPKTPSKARAWAKKLIATMEKLNGLSIDTMYKRAADMPHTHTWQKHPTAEDFGHYTAMQAIGHGVAWADDHPEHGFKIPSAMFDMLGSRDFYTSVSESHATEG